jgi:hypothetical protein
MNTSLRIDPHAHLYEKHSARAWCESAVRNLDGEGVLIIVDREGQDSFERLRREVPAFGAWTDVWDGLAGEISLPEGALLVIRGVQYVAAEKIEVLGLGVHRTLADRLPAVEYIKQIRGQGGVACLPWSPGKWLGSRGRAVKALLDQHTPDSLTVGDISLRSVLGPPSSLLRYARSQGFAILQGTDPLPRVADEALVGSFGVEVDVLGKRPLTWEDVRTALLSAAGVKGRGRRNSPVAAARRFIDSLRK